jgi:hypothetical protein
MPPQLKPKKTAVVGFVPLAGELPPRTGVYRHAALGEFLPEPAAGGGSGAMAEA